MSRILGYRMALVWLLQNDDTTWLDDEDCSPSVTAVFAADIYGHPIEKVINDLIDFRARGLHNPRNNCTRAEVARLVG